MMMELIVFICVSYWYWQLRIVQFAMEFWQIQGEFE